ncbi:MAG TPA: DsbA family protein, partial [Candidatus Thermoplasmatota archaeon]|nr:DsbA family protein [Candidatus Thermoplasmatota archaeon]
GQVEVRLRCLAIEHADEKPTPKEVLDAEAPLIMLEEPGIPYRPWQGSPSGWPSTMWPAFEAVKCAQRQGWRAALEMDWRIREAFWARGEAVALRHVLLRLARDAGLDVPRFEADWDAGACKREVVDEARRGWDEMGLELSPTFVLPSGARVENPAAPKVVLDERQGWRVVSVEPARDGPADEAYRRLLRQAASGRARAVEG